jgi:methylmalonyl-CoA epimerase (EC 5.1.99.1)
MSSDLDQNNRDMWTQRRVKRATTRPWEASTRHTLGHMSAASLPTDLFTMIDHVGVAVANLDEAIAFYSQTYGMRMLHEETNEEQGVREAMMAVGDSGSCIQLLAPLSPESTIAKFLDRSGPGIQQMAYRVADIDAVSATLRERGLRLLYDAPKRGTSNSRVNFIHPKDAGGILVELVEPAGEPAH